jgi:hypothetical protein
MKATTLSTKIKRHRIPIGASIDTTGEVYALVTPFVPAPLVDLARGKGFLGFSVTEERTVAAVTVSVAVRDVP